MISQKEIKTPFSKEGWCAWGACKDQIIQGDKSGRLRGCAREKAIGLATILADGYPAGLRRPILIPVQIRVPSAGGRCIPHAAPPCGRQVRAAWQHDHSVHDILLRHLVAASGHGDGRSVVRTRVVGRCCCRSLGCCNVVLMTGCEVVHKRQGRKHECNAIGPRGAPTPAFKFQIIPRRAGAPLPRGR